MMHGHFGIFPAVGWNDWGIGVSVSYHPPNGNCAGHVFLVLQLGPFTVDVRYCWWEAHR